MLLLPAGLRLFRALIALALALVAGVAVAGALAKPDLEALFPAPFIVGDKLAHVPVWPIFTRTGQGPVLHAQAFETIDLEPVAGYGGKPINLLVVMDRDGAFLTTRLLSHTEPIFRSAEGTARLKQFAAQYQGLSVHHEVQVLGAKAQRAVSSTRATLHGVVAGTVTALAIDRSIMEAAAQVAQAQATPAGAAGSRAQAETPKPAAGADDRYQRTGFNGLSAVQLIQPWVVENRTLEPRFAGTPAAGQDAEGTIRPQGAAIDLWLAFPGLPQAGRNLLAPSRWQEVRQLRESGTPVLMALDSSRYPLVAPSDASRAVRGATLSVTQGGRRFALAELPWQEGLRMSGQHSGVSAGATARWYRVMPSVDGVVLDVLQPMTMQLAPWRRVGGAGGSPVSVVIDKPFAIPDAAAYRPERETPRWLQAWQQRAADVAWVAALLLVLAGLLLAQLRTAASRRRLLALRLGVAVFTLVVVGWILQGQLTVVSLTSMVEALTSGRSLEFLLIDPLAVLLWAFTLITLLVWGRGTFCGWLCPFGALQELTGQVARALRLRQWRLAPQLDARLKKLKYGVLAGLLIAAAATPAAAEWLVEVEPFKTSISLLFQREWPYVLWAGACLGVGLFVYRAYCRFLCPLGAALAIVARLRRWGWIPRRAECGTPCQTCRHRCAYQAIDRQGRIDYAECFQCLDCVQLHGDVGHCLPLVARARGKVIPIRAERTGQRVAGAGRACS